MLELSELNHLGSRLRAVIVTHQSWATSIITGLAASNILSEENTTVGIIEFTPLHKPTVTEIIENRGLDSSMIRFYEGFKGFLEACRNEGAVIVHSVGYDLSLHKKELSKHTQDIRVVFTHANKGLSLILRFPVYRLIHVEGKVFRVICRGGIEYTVEVTKNGIEQVVEKESSIERRAYNIILDSMSEYGVLTIKDAVNIISANLGVDRNYARRILYKLVSDGKLRIEKGMVEIK